MNELFRWLAELIESSDFRKIKKVTEAEYQELVDNNETEDTTLYIEYED